jgi:hypothetical protein
LEQADKLVLPLMHMAQVPQVLVVEQAAWVVVVAIATATERLIGLAQVLRMQMLLDVIVELVLDRMVAVVLQV